MRAPLAAVLLLLGCYASHGLPAPAPDAGATTDAGTRCWCLEPYVPGVAHCYTGPAGCDVARELHAPGSECAYVAHP